MPERGDSSVNGLASVANIVSFTKDAVNCSITSNTSFDADNLALACHRCNLHKGPNLTGVDPVTGEVVPLFHPRRDRWVDHFAFWDLHIEGLSASGRATIQVLAMNDARRLELRRELLALGELA